ncbi:MAG: VWA domain-containing protein [Polyangiaceae bacterium]|jgi:hypothetical protein|nr:VWA domain-containing protein [Polyangiaceae bacterium]
MLKRSLLSLLPVAFLLAAACDGCDSNVACESFGTECGKACVDDFSCADGMHCGGDGTCTAECLQGGDECGEGQTCSSTGRCEDGSGGFGGGEGASTTNFGDGGNGGGTGEGGACPSVQITFAPTTPTVLLLVDQSGSMTESFGNGNRWDVLYDTLMDSNNGIVAQLEDQVRFGFALYTGQDGTCPLLSEVNIALGNYDEIDAVYGNAGPLGDTPTGDSITAVLPELLAFAEPGPKAIVLATDGEPDTCEVPNPQTGQGEAIAAAQAAFNAGVTLYIIAVGGDVSAQHQQDMANAGTGKPLDGSQGNSPYYPANDQSALANAFTEIINGVRSCILTLEGTVDPTKAGEGQVFLDGMELGYNDPNGWQLNSPSEIELLGTACETIQDGNHTVTGDFDCGIIGPPVE